MASASMNAGWEDEQEFFNNHLMTLTTCAEEEDRRKEVRVCSAQPDSP